MKLIVGLGNPWKEYANTRHNIGFCILDWFVQSGWFGSSFSFDRKYNADLLQFSYEWQNILCIKPQTFMNRSGFSVGHISAFYKINPSDILVIHDEIDFPLGKIQLKYWGSPAGHNWLKDIIAALWTNAFRRLRIGIDKPVHKSLVSDYVLSNFSQIEVDNIDNQKILIEDAIKEFLLK